MKLVNMKRKVEDSKESEASLSESEYPYGLMINLDSDQLEKLGIEKMLEVGTVLMLKAKVKVNHTSEHNSTDHESHMNMGLQITDLGLGEMEKDHAKVLYGEKD